MALAEMMECAPTYISYIESGKKSMSLKTLVIAANALHVSTDELLLDSLENTVKLTSFEFAGLLSDCSDYERKVLFDIVSSAKKALRNHKAYFNRRDYY